MDCLSGNFSRTVFQKGFILFQHIDVCRVLCVNTHLSASSSPTGVRMWGCTMLQKLVGRATTEAVSLYVTLDERVHLAFWAFDQIDFHIT